MQSLRRFLLDPEAIHLLKRVSKKRTLQNFPRRNLWKRKSKEERDEEKAKRKTERQELVGEITKGYYADIREFTAKQGKRFFASDKLLELKNAISFPKICATSLRKKEVKLNEEFSDNVTLVLMWLRAIGQGMCSEYRKPFLRKFHLHPNIKCFEINVIDSFFFKLFKQSIEYNLRKQISHENQGRFLCYYGKTAEIKRSLIENAIVGHAFLIDRTGRVRWKAHGFPTEEEIQFLLNCTEELLQENKRNLNIKKYKT